MSGPSRIKQRAREQGEGKGGGLTGSTPNGGEQPRPLGSDVLKNGGRWGWKGGRRGKRGAHMPALLAGALLVQATPLHGARRCAPRSPPRRRTSASRRAGSAPQHAPSSSGDMRCAQQQITRCHSQSPQAPPARPTGLQCRPPGSAGMRGPPPASSPAVHAPVGKGEENEKHEWGCASHWGACEQTGAGVEGTVTPTLQQLASAQRCASPQLPGTNTSAPSASIDWDRMQPKAHLLLLLHLLPGLVKRLALQRSPLLVMAGLTRGCKGGAQGAHGA